jgi:hypothetical protein
MNLNAVISVNLSAVVETGIPHYENYGLALKRLAYTLAGTPITAE